MMYFFKESDIFLKRKLERRKKEVFFVEEWRILLECKKYIGIKRVRVVGREIGAFLFLLFFLEINLITRERCFTWADRQQALISFK